MLYRPRTAQATGTTGMTIRMWVMSAARPRYGEGARSDYVAPAVTDEQGEEQPAQPPEQHRDQRPAAGRPEPGQPGQRGPRHRKPLPQRDEEPGSQQQRRRADPTRIRATGARGGQHSERARGQQRVTDQHAGEQLLGAGDRGVDASPGRDDRGPVRVAQVLFAPAGMEAQFRVALVGRSPVASGACRGGSRAAAGSRCRRPAGTAGAAAPAAVVTRMTSAVTAPSSPTVRRPGTPEGTRRPRHHRARRPAAAPPCRPAARGRPARARASTAEPVSGCDRQRHRRRRKAGRSRPGPRRPAVPVRPGGCDVGEREQRRDAEPEEGRAAPRRTGREHGDRPSESSTPPPARVAVRVGRRPDRAPAAGALGDRLHHVVVFQLGPLSRAGTRCNTSPSRTPCGNRPCAVASATPSLRRSSQPPCFSPSSARPSPACRSTSGSSSASGTCSGSATSRRRCGALIVTLASPSTRASPMTQSSDSHRR